MISINRYILSSHTLKKFINEALHFTLHTDTLSGINYNRDLLKAALANTYLEAVWNRAESLHLVIKNSSIKDIRDSMFSRIIALSKPFNFPEKYVLIAYDYTYWDFYGKSSNQWRRGNRGEWYNR